MRRTRWMLMATLACGLPGCASMRSVTLDVREQETPAQGALVRAIPLTEGMVPLPLNDSTLQEILLLRKKSQQAVVNERGVARLRLRSGVAHVVEVESPGWKDAPRFGEEQELHAWILDEDGRGVEPAQAGGSARYTLRVSR